MTELTIVRRHIHRLRPVVADVRGVVVGVAEHLGDGR
jgi:hypothetical protein